MEQDLRMPPHGAGSACKAGILGGGFATWRFMHCHKRQRYAMSQDCNALASTCLSSVMGLAYLVQLHQIQYPQILMHIRLGACRHCMSSGLVARLLDNIDRDGHSCVRDSMAVGHASCAAHLAYRHVHDSPVVHVGIRLHGAPATTPPAPDLAGTAVRARARAANAPNSKQSAPAKGAACASQRTWMPGGHCPLKQRVHSAGSQRACVRGPESQAARCSHTIHSACTYL